MSIYIPLNLTHRCDPQDWGSSSIQVMWLIFYYVCMYLYIGGFAKVKAAIHKLTGEKVSYTGLQTYIYIHIYVLLNRLPLRLWIKFNLGWVRIHIYIHTSDTTIMNSCYFVGFCSILLLHTNNVHMASMCLQYLLNSS